jgi:hypothetical protein
MQDRAPNATAEYINLALECGIYLGHVSPIDVQLGKLGYI